jgi:hydroxyacylglutathione hydrolase
MFLEKLKSDGLSHLSYIIGHSGEAAVIDPRRDVSEYVEIAHAHGAAITCIFETHRNEDYVIGSQELSRRTGADIYHGKATDFAYGNPVEEGDIFQVGDLLLKVIETPGHTYDSISIAAYDTSFSNNEPIAVFTGDALFIGDVGRTDFFPDRKEEVAGLLYDSIFEKLLPLGDQVLLYPAHGAGSVCGSGMAQREFSTLGYEKRNNPALQFESRQAFVDFKVNEHHYMPPYFKKMEEYNQFGNVPQVCNVPSPRPMGVGEFKKRMDEGMLVLDTRSAEAFAGAFIPGSLAMPLHMIPAYAGYFLDYDTEIGLVVDNRADVEIAERYLLRIGYDTVAGYLEGGLNAWEKAGKEYGRIPAVHVNELVRRITENEEYTLLDVRKQEEVEQGRLPGSRHVFLGHLPDKLDEVPRDRPVTTFCGSGERAIIAASILKRAGIEQVEDALGSMAACASQGCPIES